MAMDFWDAQRRARKKTALYLSLFLGMSLFVGILAEVGYRIATQDNSFPFVGPLFIGITLAAAGFQYLRFRALGGAHVALSVGATEVSPNTSDSQEQQLLNVVSEIAIASSMPIPKVFIIPAQQINAFAAGLTPNDAAIAVTQGTLDTLTRDELQGVIAHEFGHIANGDMTIGLRLAAMVMGFFFVLYIGLRVLQFSGSGRKKDGAPVVAIALLLVCAGAITWLFGSILKASVSREREYLADASAVQFTRNSDGIAGALRKIQAETNNDMPKAGMAFSHLYIDSHQGLQSFFATHPPLSKRIAAIENYPKTRSIR